MYQSERGPNPPVRWHERLIFWGALFPASVVTMVWLAVMCYIGWGWICR